MRAPKTLKLAAHGQEAVLWPGLGGRIAAWRTAGGWDGLAPIPTDQPLEAALRQGGCHPLAPYCNRIENARFAWREREVKLTEGPLASPHSLHGPASRRPFRVERAVAASVRLVLEHKPDADWPWAFELVQNVRLTPGALELELSLRNTDREAQPVGLGFHPFFPRRRSAILRFAAGGWWRLRPDGVPIAREPIPPGRDFHAGRLAPQAGYDDLYAGFGGEAEIRWPGCGLTVTAAPGLDHAVLFTPPAGEAFAFQPVGHPANAHNMAGAPGLAALAPGACLQAWMRLEPFE